MKSVDVSKALKKVLKMTYNVILTDFILEPSRVEWRYACQFKADPEFKWYPRIITYYPTNNKIAIRNKINDPMPLHMDAAVLLKMATYDNPDAFKKDGA